MAKNVTQKLIESHLVEDRMTPGKEIGFQTDQTLTHDATGTPVMLEYEALGIPRVRAEFSAQYGDNKRVQKNFKNSDLCQNRSRDGPIDFHCHHGIHSQAATQQMLHEGLGHVYISKVESRPSTELLN